MKLLNIGKIALGLAAALITAPALGQAETPPAIEALVQERAQRLAEQRTPRTAIPFEPRAFDKYIGLYQDGFSEFFAITREGDHFFAGPDGSQDQRAELYPESPTSFFAKTFPAQISFTLDAKGNVTGLRLHSNGFEVDAPRVDEAAAKAGHAKLAARIKDKTPSPGVEAALRRYIAAFQHGTPDYEDMIPISAVLTHERVPEYTDHFQKWGALKSLTFVEVMPNGFNKYLAVYEQARAEMIIEPLTPEGKVAGIRIGKIEQP